MKRIFVLALFFVSITSLAIAADDVAVAGYSVIAAQIGAIIIEILKPIACLLGTWAVYKLAKKLGLDISAVEKELIQTAIKNGINYVENWTTQQSTKPTSEVKLQKCIEFVNMILTQAGFKQKASDYLASLIEAQLQWDKQIKR
jgi:hypothetical protein